MTHVCLCACCVGQHFWNVNGMDSFFSEDFSVLVNMLEEPAAATTVTAPVMVSLKVHLPNGVRVMMIQRAGDSVEWVATKFNAIVLTVRVGVRACVRASVRTCVRAFVRACARRRSTCLRARRVLRPS